MDQRVAKGLAKAGVYEARRHLFVCIGPDCCHRKEGEALWDEIKSRTKKTPLMRTKAACLRVCHAGPWLVVYPEGVWYGEVTPERFKRIYEEHILGGRVVEEWAVIRNDLHTPPGADD